LRLELRPSCTGEHGWMQFIPIAETRRFARESE
jgi:hypothetical protein